jgi:putative oxidoreductase
MAIETTIKRIRARLLALTERLSFLAPALIRLTLALVFIESGWGKLQALDKVTEYFASLGIPLPGFNARLTACTELFGGALFLLGLGTRLVSLPLAFTMLIALITARREEITGFTSLLGQVEWAYLVMFVTVALLGPGALSLDALIARRSGRVGGPVLPRPMPG